MTHPNGSTPTSIAAAGGTAGLIGTVVTRVVVPLWLLAGALLKLADASPTHLPSALVKWLGPMGLDLMFVVRFGIAIELTVVGVMWLLPSMARYVGLAILAAFMPILIGEVAMGASSCGCFGSVEVNPWLTLVLDVSFFAAILFLGRRSPALQWRPELSATRVLIAGVWTIAAFVAGFGPWTAPASAPGTTAGGRNEVDVIGGTEAAAPPLPADGYYVPDYAAWVGRPFVELEMSRWIRGLPPDLDEGVQYVLFYRKDCEHCHELIQVYFMGQLEFPTTAVAIPERDGFPATEIPFECDECRLAELPAGVDWFVQTPVLVRLNGGVVACASETSAADPRCLAY